MAEAKDVGELLTDQTLQWGNGARPRIEDIVREHNVANDADVVDLIYNEVLLREELGESPKADEYIARFPDLENSLRRQFQIHSGLGSSPGSTLSPGSTIDPAKALDLQTRPIEIPGFELLDVIGRGGSAVCYRARDVALNRIVAVKLLSNVDATDVELRSQLLREAEAAASLVHPAIVSIHQTGEAEGVPFLVLEYVSGGSLADKLKGGLPETKEATEIAHRVAKAVQYAHEQGVIHRDIKPGNILLDDDGKPRVCDFGLAKKLDPTETRASTNIVGTPAYMAPEQARGEKADVRADVYSIGATLYEMLVGRSPFQAATTWDTLYQVMTSEPVSVRKLNHAVPMDLETICAKCLDKRVDHRYESARLLAEDLQRFLENRPIRARRVTTHERFWRWCGRNRGLAASLGVGAVLAGLLLVGSVFAAMKFRSQNEQLVRTLETSIEAADQLLVSVTEDTELLPKTPGSQEVSKRLLDRARKYYSTFLEENSGDPRLRYQLARTHAGLAMVGYRLGELETVETETAAALSLLDELETDSGPTNDMKLLRARLLRVHGAALQGALRSSEALPKLEEALAVCEDSFEKEPDNRDVLEQLARTLSDIANVHQTLGDSERSEKMLTEAKVRYAGLLEQVPDSVQYVLSAAKVEHGLGNSKSGEGLDAMAVHYRAGIGLLKGLSEEAQQSVQARYQLATSSMNLGRVHAQLGELDKAAEYYEVAIAELKRLVELEPSVNRHKYVYALAVMNSGSVDSQMNEYERMVARIAFVLPVVDKLVQAEPDNLGHRELRAMMSDNMAYAQQQLGQLDEAIASLRGTEATLREIAEATDFGPEAMYSWALNRYMLANTLSDNQQFDDALTAAAESLEYTKQGLKKNSSNPDLLVHEIDIVVLRAETQLKMKPVPFDQVMRDIDAGLARAKKLRETMENVLVKQAITRLYLTRADAWFLQDDLAKNEMAINAALEQLNAEFEAPYDGDVNELFAETHLKLARSLSCRLMNDVSNSDLESRMKQAIKAAESFGADSEQIAEALATP